MARETRQQLRQKSRQSQLRHRQEDKRMGQLERPQAIEKVGVRTARVSKALWPTAARRALALNRELLVHKRLAGLSRCRAWLSSVLGRAHVWIAHSYHAPETPMPSEPPLVRVLETVDLSRTDVEHFFETHEERDTAEISLDWMKSEPMYSASHSRQEQQ